MEITPLQRYSAPRYPTRDIVDAQPELLRVLPNRWQRSAVVGAALVAASGLSLGYRVQAAEQEKSANATLAVSRVAPIFQHGLGHVLFRGDGPGPVMLTEDEARQVVQEELTRALRMSNAPAEITPDGLTVRNLPVTLPEGRQPSPEERVLVLDGWVNAKKIGYECISRADEIAWVDGNSDMRYLATYNPPVTAQRVRDSLAEAKPEGAFAVFYSPEVDYQTVYENYGPNKPDWETMEHDAKMLARFVLREQVRDFVKWLKAEGVI